LFNGFLTEKVD